MCAPLVVFLSATVLHSVSAGGVYCAETARARAAALGLEYPGVHGAPDLHTAAHHVMMHPGTVPSEPRPYENNDPELGATESNMASYEQNQPGLRSLHDGAQAHTRSSETTFLLSSGTYLPVQSEYSINQELSFPREHSASDHKSDFFEEVKHAAPSTWVEAPGWSDLVNWNPQGRRKPLSFVYNKLDLAVDESVPNRRGMSLSGLPLPQSRGHGTYQRGLTGFGLRREVPVLASSRFHNKGHVRAMTGRSPVFGRRERIGLPDHLAQSLRRNLNVKPFVKGNPVLRRLMKTKIGQNKSLN
ncbi:uncharacterized protein LOC130172532 isoform X2 [Seriola aureovittata]|uniref:uncharacterized protein LOC130172532 isoform X2 n=1 Tax=Seriola aureovittata TaxID=2871759 RepID=UPI0024BDF5E7|nr:uncharacterized protein LOC130172532 isoform X2 [Seriola aureovittata]